MERGEGDRSASLYAAAIDATRDTLRQRASRYRWLVVSIAILFVTSLIGAVGWRDWRPLFLLLYQPSAVLLFCAIDTMAVQRWRADVLAGWFDGRLGLNVLVSFLRQVPGLPPRTLEGMLASLPAQHACEVPIPVRLSLKFAQADIARGASARLVGSALGWAIAATVLGAASIWRTPLLLPPIVVALAIAIAMAVRHRRRLRDASATVERACRDAGLDTTTASALWGHPDWRGVDNSRT
ncbi:hypothetical protein [Variovorax rhizosphaerae]|uniref:Uncharacterized protein n=1 Tax=Variovorax rhizosphaerae TaxID=1836200 RepID=A0ABU8WCF0_9BURK